MASHTARRFALAIACIFFIFLVARLLPAAQKGPVNQHTLLTPHRLRGQWKEFRASLRLPPLADVVYFPEDPDNPLVPHTNRMLSRFDLKRKRSMETITQKSLLPQLHFAADVRENPSVSLQALTASFRAIALTEKSIIGPGQTKIRIETHGKLQRGQRRPRSRKVPLKKRR